MTQAGRPKLKTNHGLCILGCRRPIRCKSVCDHCYRKMHYESHERARRGATKTDTLPIGSKRMTSEGYVEIKIADIRGRSHKGNWVKEHRHVMGKLLGRSLRPFENVHHKNGRRFDNRPRNLELWITCQPRGQRVKDVVIFAKWILTQYGENYGQPKMSLC